MNYLEKSPPTRKKQHISQTYFSKTKQIKAFRMHFSKDFKLQEINEWSSHYPAVQEATISI